MKFFIILAWEWKVKVLRNNTATFTHSNYYLSFEVMNWLFYHLLFRWILCKKQSLTTHLECPFLQRRNKLFLVMSVSFALTRMWVPPFHCSLQSGKLKSNCSEYIHLFILACPPAATPLGGPLIPLCQISKGFGFNTRNLSNRVPNIKEKSRLSLYSQPHLCHFILSFTSYIYFWKILK